MKYINDDSESVSSKYICIFRRRVHHQHRQRRLFLPDRLYDHFAYTVTEYTASTMTTVVPARYGKVRHLYDPGVLAACLDCHHDHDHDHDDRGYSSDAYRNIDGLRPGRSSTRGEALRATESFQEEG